MKKVIQSRPVSPAFRCKGQLWFGENKLEVLGFIGVSLVLVLGSQLSPVDAFNDEKGILKWNPYWFSNFRYSAPSAFYISPNRVRTPLKRLSESVGVNSDGIYKWSPVFFSSNTGSTYGGGISPFPSNPLGGGNYMYSSSRPRWQPSYFPGGGSRTKFTTYHGDSTIPAFPRSSILDLGSNDLGALIGSEMANGLDLDNDRVDILGDNEISNAHPQGGEANK